MTLSSKYSLKNYADHTENALLFCSFSIQKAYISAVGRLYTPLGMWEGRLTAHAERMIYSP